MKSFPFLMLVLNLVKIHLILQAVEFVQAATTVPAVDRTLKKMGKDPTAPKGQTKKTKAPNKSSKGKPSAKPSRKPSPKPTPKSVKKSKKKKSGKNSKKRNKKSKKSD